MNKEGWGYAIIASNHEHYFVSGKSICEKFLLLGHKVFETTSNPCPDCLKILITKNKEKQNALSKDGQETDQREQRP